MPGKYRMVLVAAILSIILIGCATMTKPQQQEEVAKYEADFIYTPTVQATPGSAGVTFAINNLTYNFHPNADVVAWYNTAQLANLPDTVKQDLSKLLVAKGFTVLGPFDTYDLIPFADKKAIDLLMIPTMELSVAFNNTKTVYDSLWCIRYIVSGDVEVTGKIILELREILTRELMWSKVIPITRFGFSCTTDSADPVNSDNIVMNDVAKGLEKQYPDLMATIAKLIDLEEMKIIKKQCQELKSKKGY